MSLSRWVKVAAPAEMSKAGEEEWLLLCVWNVLFDEESLQYPGGAVCGFSGGQVQPEGQLISV